MQKKLLIGALAVVIIAGGAYAIFHKSPAKPAASSNNSVYGGSTGQNQAASNTNIIQTKSASGVGQYLATSSGLALYTYGGDTTGKSNCSGSCIYSWPVYGPGSISPSALPANVTIITRSDGTKQYTYKGLPLYTFSGDSVGQVTGDGVSNFHIAKP